MFDLFNYLIIYWFIKLSWFWNSSSFYWFITISLLFISCIDIGSSWWFRNPFKWKWLITCAINILQLAFRNVAILQLGDFPAVQLANIICSNSSVFWLVIFLGRSHVTALIFPPKCRPHFLRQSSYFTFAKNAISWWD